MPRYKDEELAILLDACKNHRLAERNRAMLVLLMETGIRATELLCIEAGDIDFAEASLLIREGKGHKQRRIPLTPRARTALWRWKTRRPKDTTSNQFFCSERGGTMDYEAFRDLLRRLSLATGIEVQAHKFRRTFATNYAGTGQLFALQKILGHTSLTMVRRYAELSFTQVQTDYDRTMQELDSKKSPKPTMKLLKRKAAGS